MTSEQDEGVSGLPGKEEQSVEVRFVTRLGKEFQVTDEPFSVPARLTRHGLSEIVNHLLGRVPDASADEEDEGEMADEEEKKKLRPIPFDFLISGEFLRTSLRKHLTTRGVAVGEGIVTLEYTLALSKPDSKPPYPHGDWIDALCTTVLPDGTDLCASGGYLCSVKLWDSGLTGKSGLVCTMEKAHIGAAVKCLCGIGPDNQQFLRERGVAAIASGGKDTFVKAWSLSSIPPAEAEENKRVRADVAAVFAGHQDAVECIDSSPDGSRLCSGSWDRTIRIWDSAFLCDGTTEAEAAPSSKRRKDDDDEEEGEKDKPETDRKEAVAVLEGHTSVVNTVQWPTHMQLISGGNDCALRLWDVIKGTNVSTIHSSRAVNRVAYSTENGLCASGHPDGIVRLWDPRSAHGSIEAKTIRAHKGWVSAVAWHPSQTTVLLTASYDGSLKIWDLRASAAMHVARNVNGGKVLCAQWWKHQDGSTEIISGGVDGFISRRPMP